MNSAKHLHCPHCDRPIFRKSSSGARYKAKTTIVVLHKSGDVEINCTACKRAVILSRGKIELRKSVFTIPKS
jgi:hypothetical protein